MPELYVPQQVLEEIGRLQLELTISQKKIANYQNEIAALTAELDEARAKKKK